MVTALNLPSILEGAVRLSNHERPKHQQRQTEQAYKENIYPLVAKVRQIIISKPRSVFGIVLKDAAM